MTTTAEILKKIRKDHGDSIAVIGSSKLVDVLRLPTTIFSVDLATGGGFPQGKCSIVYGPESSNKTNLVLLTLAEAQRQFPDKKVVFVDAEHALDRKWASTLGVDLDRMIILSPESAEQAVDFIESFLYADDVSVVVLDSIAALITQREMENSAEVVAVGGASLLIGKLYRKVTVAYSKMRNSGLTGPAFIAINQLRHKIGVTHGNPETMPGGFPPKFAASMILRVYGKNVMDTKVHKALPLYKEVNVVLQKWKVPILSVNATYTMQMIPASGRKPGYISDWNTVSAYMKELDYLSKGEKGGWVMSGQPYKTLDECREVLYGDKDMLADMKATIIKELIDLEGTLEPSGELPSEDEQ